MQEGKNENRKHHCIYFACHWRHQLVAYWHIWVWCGCRGVWRRLKHCCKHHLYPCGPQCNLSYLHCALSPQNFFHRWWINANQIKKAKALTFVFLYFVNWFYVINMNSNAVIGFKTEKVHQNKIIYYVVFCNNPLWTFMKPKFSVSVLFF